MSAKQFNKSTEIEKVIERAADAYVKLNFPEGETGDVECARLDFEAGFCTAVERYEQRGLQILRGLEAIEKTANKYSETYALAEIRYMIQKLKGLK